MSQSMWKVPLSLLALLGASNAIAYHVATFESEKSQLVRRVAKAQEISPDGAVASRSHTPVGATRNATSAKEIASDGMLFETKATSSRLIRTEGEDPSHDDAEESKVMHETEAAANPKEASADPKSEDPKSATPKSANPKDDDTALKAMERLPLWAQVLGGILVTAIILIIYKFIKGKIMNVVPGGVDSQRLQVVLSEALEKVEVLKAQLEDRYRATDAPEDEDPATAADPVVVETRARARSMREAADLRAQQMREAAARTAEQRDQLIEGAARAKEVLSEGLEGGRSHMEAFTKEQTHDMYSKLEAAVNDGNPPAWQAPDWMAATSEEEDCISLPPVLNLIQGALATNKIHGLRDGSATVVILDFLIIVASAVTFALNWKKECHDIEVWVWHIGFLSITTLDIMCRSLIVRWSDAALVRLKASQDKLDAENGGMPGGSLFDKFTFLQGGGSMSFFAPYFQYHHIADSWTVLFVQFLIFINLGWGGFGLWVSIQDVVVDSLGCKANIAIVYMHSYSFLYVMFLTMNLVMFIPTFLEIFASSSCLKGPILRAAKSFDDDTMGGVPIALTIVQSFVLKNSASELAMGKREVEDELRDLNKRLEIIEEELKHKKPINERLVEEVAHLKTQEECLDHYSKLTSDALEQVKPFVGLLAANVPTVDITDPEAGSTTAATPAQARPGHRLSVVPKPKARPSMVTLPVPESGRQSLQPVMEQASNLQEN